MLNLDNNSVESRESISPKAGRVEVARSISTASIATAIAQPGEAAPATAIAQATEASIAIAQASVVGAVVAHGISDDEPSLLLKARC
jgi:hypothetical protein